MPPRRKCIPNVHRDAYVSTRRSSGISEVAVRVTERYIDEFLRFCDEETGSTDVTLVNEEQMRAYAKKLRKVAAMKDTTRLKLREVFKWFDWLAEQKVIGRNSAQSLDVAELIP